MAPGPSPIGYAGMRMSADDYLALGETFEWYEFIDGVVLEHERRSLLHQELLLGVICQLHRLNDLDLLMSTDVRFSDSHVYCPDVLVYRAERFVRCPERLTIPPDLIVEISTPCSHSLDRFTKRDDYDRFGVGEYWILDSRSGELIAYQRPTPNAPFARIAPGGPTVTAKSIDNLAIDLVPLHELIETHRAELSNQS